MKSHKVISMDAEDMLAFLKGWHTDKTPLGIAYQTPKEVAHVSFVGTLEEIAPRLAFRSVGVSEGASVIFATGEIALAYCMEAGQDDIGPDQSFPERYKNAVRTAGLMTIFVLTFKDAGVLTLVELAH